jgi:molecular chaperone GrpE
VMETQSTEVPHGTVTQVLQAGYLIEDRILRPAMVVVAKGGPKPSADQSSSKEAELSLDDVLQDDGNGDSMPPRDDTP